MCGISGICSFDEPKIGEAVIKSMTDELRHRGPDDEGYYFNPRKKVMLGHRRLSIIDLSKMSIITEIPKIPFGREMIFIDQ